jgi:hypothetical protein
MKLKSKLKLYEEFVNVTRQVNDSAATKTDVAIDKVTVDKENTIRTEITKDVDSILNNLIELSDRIGEGVEIEINELYEELFQLLNVSDLNEGILDFIKSPIKFMKIQKNMKMYQKALVQQSISEIDFAKKKEASKEDPNPKALEVLKQAHLTKNLELKNQIDAIGERMGQLSEGDEGLAKVVAVGKSKSKLAAAKIVMKAASGEEAKALKLKVETLEDRVADDEKSLKDYTAKAGPTDKEKADKEAQDAIDKQEIKDKSAENTKDIKTAEAPTKTAPAAKTKDADKTPPADKTEPKGGKEGEEETDPKDAEIEKLETAKTTAKEAYDALPEDADMKTKAAAKVKLLQIQLKQAELKEDDAEVIDGFKQELEQETAKMNAKVIPQVSAPAEETDEVTEEGLSFDAALIEASVSGLMASDEEEDGYKYLKAQAKKLGVKVSVNKDPYGDGYDELGFSGDKAAVMKLAGISGHAEDITDGVYDLSETKEVELPKTIKLDESMTIAEKFARLMNK